MGIPNRSSCLFLRPSSQLSTSAFASELAIRHEQRISLEPRQLIAAPKSGATADSTRLSPPLSKTISELVLVRKGLSGHFPSCSLVSPLRPPACATTQIPYLLKRLANLRCRRLFYSTRLLPIVFRQRHFIPFHRNQEKATSQIATMSSPRRRIETDVSSAASSTHNDPRAVADGARPETRS